MPEARSMDWEPIRESIAATIAYDLQIRRDEINVSYEEPANSGAHLFNVLVSDVYAVSIVIANSEVLINSRGFSEILLRRTVEAANNLRELIGGNLDGRFAMPSARQVDFEMWRQRIAREIQVVLGLRSGGVEVLFDRPYNEDIYKFRIRVGRYENYIIITGREVRANTSGGIQAIMEHRITDVAERLRDLLIGGEERRYEAPFTAGPSGYGGMVARDGVLNMGEAQRRMMRVPTIEDANCGRLTVGDIGFWRNDTDRIIREGELVQSKDVGGAKGMECMRMVRGKLVCATIV